MADELLCGHKVCPAPMPDLHKPRQLHASPCLLAAWGVLHF